MRGKPRPGTRRRQLSRLEEWEEIIEMVAQSWAKMEDTLMLSRPPGRDAIKKHIKSLSACVDVMKEFMSDS